MHLASFETGYEMAVVNAALRAVGRTSESMFSCFKF